MTLADILPWLNLLMLPGVSLLLRITRQLAVLETRQDEQARRLERIDSDLAELRM
ncbi:hypothetical protein [Piscinibacter sp.]|uniref:hypothetical protein n=1 Tax=Piscinibacter sp. TaxID=1903157 RepID=UPI0039E54EA8